MKFRNAIYYKKAINMNEIKKACIKSGKEYARAFKYPRASVSWVRNVLRTINDPITSD